MGAYLSTPVTEKGSEDGVGNRIRYGASSMQGWRSTQEDAHHCVAEFDEKSSLFGVYDGHGGSEVAIYVAKHFPEIFKGTEAYSQADFEKAFVQAYLKMDASIKEPQVLEELQRLAKKENEDEDGEATADYAEENVKELYEEATMPLNELVAKYKKGGETVTEDETDSGAERPCSSSKMLAGASENVKVQQSDEDGPCSSSFSSSANPQSTNAEEQSVAASSTEQKVTNGEIDEIKGDDEKETATVSSSKMQCNGNGEQTELMDKVDANGKSEIIESSKKEVVIVDATEESKTGVDNEEDSPSPSKPRKGKVQPVPVVLKEVEKMVRAAAKAAKINMMAFEDDSSDLDSSSGSEDDAVGEEESDDSEDMEEDEDEEEEDSDEEEDDQFLSDLQEPGFDSGTTAVVSFLRWEGDEKLHLWVANAGDSRCVVNRGGVAVDMSFDHKPELEEEALRIVKAGGKVTDDGRVNGGLNLSRALGDHSYKHNTFLPLEEQMISPMPSIEHLELNPKTDEFIVLACDGIWNSMSSQQVVDFVKRRIRTAPSLSKICEELFETCLAEDTCGDGTGCDNMTAIIIQLSDGSGKRQHEETEKDCSEDVEQASKRQKVASE